MLIASLYLQKEWFHKVLKPHLIINFTFNIFYKSIPSLTPNNII
jgi:hypothetical protein